MRSFAVLLGLLELPVLVEGGNVPTPEQLHWLVCSANLPISMDLQHCISNLICASLPTKCIRNENDEDPLSPQVQPSLRSHLQHQETGVQLAALGILDALELVQEQIQWGHFKLRIVLGEPTHLLKDAALRLLSVEGCNHTTILAV